LLKTAGIELRNIKRKIDLERDLNPVHRYMSKLIAISIKSGLSCLRTSIYAVVALTPSKNLKTNFKGIMAIADVR
jgi:hypothetical protein